MAPVWFITATSSGFGREMALSALALGHTVIATARSTAKIQDLKDAGAHVLAFDVTAPQADIEALAASVFAQHGRVDYLVNVAGYILEGAVEELTRDEVYQSFNTNVFSAMNIIQAFLPHLRRQPVGENSARATIASFGSVGSWFGAATLSVYVMTKWSVSALMESLQLELAPFQIRAVTIETGYFRTALLEPSAKQVAKKRLDAYEDPSTPSGQTRKVLPEFVNGNQPGDPVKGGKIAVDVLTSTGVAEGKELPVRIVIGSDSEQMIRQKCNSTLQLLDEWKDVIPQSDFPKGS